MLRAGGMALFLAIIGIGGAVRAADKKEVRIEKIAEYDVRDMRIQPVLTTADTCITIHSDTMVWQIDNWVVGTELYKAYLDPETSCPNPYPYTITEINMPMSFATATPLYVSVDVEAVDISNPSCPAPGGLLAISAQYELQVPGPGVYSIWIPLDTPYVVEGPFFAGFYIGNPLDPYVGAAVITDNSPALCTSYNIWDTATGFVDLNDNEFYSFPGRLILMASGIPGGNAGAEPVPEIELVWPLFDDTLLGRTEIWANETSGSGIVEYVAFEYSRAGGGFIEIGRDYDGSHPLRNGVDFSGYGDGWVVDWDFAYLSEGVYTLRITACDSLNRSTSVTSRVYVEPTPPIPKITAPADGVDFCIPLDILISCSDDDLFAIEIFRHAAAEDYSIDLDMIDQATLGDNNGNPYDGNLVSNGEFGDYYCGPAAAALAVKVWYDRGYTSLYDPPVENLAEQLATPLRTRENKGTYDEDMLRGLYEFFLDKGALLDFDYKRNPDYYAMRTWLEYEERSVLIGVGGSPGVWLAVDGFKGWAQTDGTYLITVSDPLTGSISDLPIRHNVGTSEIFFNSSWQPIALGISLFARNWAIIRDFVGSDSDGCDGWAYIWSASDLIDGGSYYIHASATDATNISGISTALAKYDCSHFYTHGDFNNDGYANFADFTYLIDFLTHGGAPPVGGIKRGDCNCDNYVNIADAVYFLNFMFGTAGAPCY